MRVVVIGDVHANVEALTALADLLDDADQIVCVGDVVGYYCQVNEAICAIANETSSAWPETTTGSFSGRWSFPTTRLCNSESSLQPR